jgi:hypothetical protein
MWTYRPESKSLPDERKHSRPLPVAKKWYLRLKWCYFCMDNTIDRWMSLLELKNR